MTPDNHDGDKNGSNEGWADAPRAAQVDAETQAVSAVEPVVRRPKPSRPDSTKTATSEKGQDTKTRTGTDKTGTDKATKDRDSKTRTTKDKAAKQSQKVAAKTEKSQAARAKGKKRFARRQVGLGQYLVMPDLRGPKITLGLIWLVVAVGAVLAGRWATTVLWALVAAAAAWHVTTAWDSSARRSPGFSKYLAAGGAAIVVVATGIGTAMGGLALVAVPLLIAVFHLLAGVKPADAGAAEIGVVLSSIAAGSVVLVVRTETWAGLFLVFAVSLYDAGYFVGAADSTSRMEGPITGMIGVFAVSFAAAAVEATPFDRVTAWVAGVLIAVSCPLGQMIVSAYLPKRDVRAPAMRRLDAYLVAGPLLFISVLVIGG